GSETLPLVQVGETNFQVENLPIEYRFNDDRSTVVDTMPLANPCSYERAEEFKPAPAELQEYEGTYYSEEVELRYHVTLEDGSLMLSSMKLTATPLRAATADLFGGWFGRVRFTRDSQGWVSGMRFSTMRIRSCRFDRIR